MSRRIEIRIGDLLSGDATGCGFLSRVEAEALADGTLDATRRTELESHAAGCPDCADLLGDLATFASVADDGLSADERKAFDASGRDDDEPVAPVPPVLPGPRFVRWLAPVAALAAVIVFVVMRTPPPLIDDPGVLPFAPPPAIRGADDEAWEAAREAWDRGDEAAAETALRGLVEADPTDADAWYHLGVARLARQDPVEAAAAFRRADELLAGEPSPLARWGLAVALDQAGRRDEACDALRGLASLDGDRAAEAAAIVAERCD